MNINIITCKNDKAKKIDIVFHIEHTTGQCIVRQTTSFDSNILDLSKKVVQTTKNNEIIT